METSIGKQNIFMECRKFLGTQLLEKFIEISYMSSDYFVSQDLIPPHISTDVKLTKISMQQYQD